MGSLYSSYTGVNVFRDFTFSEPRIVIHVCEKDQQLHAFS
jgi:hypothetical protein